MSVELGQPAPEFTLKDQAGNDVSLSDYQGKQPVVLVFYPFTFTGVCQGELCEIRDDPSVFEDSDAAVLAISCDTRHAQAQWAEQQGFTFPVLSDFWPHGEVAEAYGVFNEQLGCANRANVRHRPRRAQSRQVRIGRPRVAAGARGLRTSVGEGDMKFSDMMGKGDKAATKEADDAEHRCDRAGSGTGARGTDPVR